MYVYLYRFPVFPSTCQKLLCRSVPLPRIFIPLSYPWRTTTLNTLLYTIRTRVRENSTSQCLSNQTKHEYNLQFNSKLIRTIHYTPKVLAAGNTYILLLLLLLLLLLSLLLLHHLHVLDDMYIIYICYC